MFIPRRYWLITAICCLGHWSTIAVAEDSLLAGFAETDITPDTKGEKPVWLAGYGPGRKATGVHDPLKVRCVVLTSGRDKIALVSVDLVGLQYPTVKKIREKLPDYRYVMVSSTHNHEGPDVVGIWGKTLIHSGVDPAYLRTVVDEVVRAVRQAETGRTEVRVKFGTASDESLLHDSRKPIVYDGVLRALCFISVKNDKTVGLLMQWNCHPEALGSRNTLVTADFPWATVAALKKQYGCPVVYCTGTVGGLMAPPRGNIKNAAGVVLKEGDYEFARLYGRQVAKLAAKAVESSEPIRLTPFTVSARRIAVPVENPYYRAAHTLGVLLREAWHWTGSSDRFGKPLGPSNIDKPMAIDSEVAYLRLGQLHVACIPGEIYPELVYGKFQEPVDPGADFPDAPLEPTVRDLMPGKKWMLLGLANDEIGYIIPRRQWDQKPPYAYGRKRAQYGEINSCGSQVAPIIMQALADRVREASKE